MARTERPSGQSSQQVFSAMYTNQVAVNFGKGMADPFVPAFARFLGATTAELGWLQAFVNLFPTVMQVPWGKLSDFLGKRVPFLIVGGVLSFSLYFFMIGVVSAWQLIIVVAAQMFIGSMMIPTWSALVGDVTNVRNRGTVMSRFFAASSLASLLATLVAGALMPDPEVGRAAATAFVIPLVLAGVCGIAGSLALYNVREGKRKMYASPRRMFAFSMRSFIFMSDLTENVHFRNLVVLQTTFNFIMSLIWPLIYFTYIDVVEASLFEIAIMTVISTGAALFFQTKVGKLLDVIGPMPQILVSRFAFVFVPVVYALATAPWHIYVLHAALGFANAMANVAFFAFILDVAPEGKKGEYFAVYNTVIGVATFFGSIIGGYLALFFLSYYGGDLVLALGAVYVISAVGRAACAIWYLKLKDPVQYPKTLRSLIKETIGGWCARVRCAL
jgi:MFS family permease